MFRILILFPAFFVATYAACVPDHTDFYWESPCQGQKFTNLIDVKTLTATQKNVSVNANGGLDLTVPIDLTLGIVDNYGRIGTPLVDIEIQAYSGIGTTCKWRKQPTFSLLDNIDGCTIIPKDECHLENNPTSITATIDLKALLQDFLTFVTVGDYYGLAVTVKDGDKPLACSWAQDKVIAK